ncbi:MAG: GNAT family N-acetyltransferase [Christensenellaceae bacterium]|jgi:GNAT superfamily N-acetyltransferase|nr:GNAT family N-acetyltransferase [Christensenellaceae bacterium]
MAFSIRPASESDAATIVRFIRELAQYEGMLEFCVLDEETLRESMFQKKQAFALIGETGEGEKEPVGYALFFYNFSTFMGKKGLYIEDIYVQPACRGRGYGKAFFRALAKIAQAEGCPRMEWNCLRWNEPSLGFYRALGAEQQDEWILHRLTAGEIAALAK